MEVVDDSDDIFEGYHGLAVRSEPELQDGGQPMSLNKPGLAGVGVEMSEEEYSSSSDSDDD